jgi:hypothetical protein
MDHPSMQTMHTMPLNVKMQGSSQNVGYCQRLSIHPSIWQQVDARFAPIALTDSL